MVLGGSVEMETYRTSDHVEVEIETDLGCFLRGEVGSVVFAAEEAELFAGPPADAYGVVDFV